MEAWDSGDCIPLFTIAVNDEKVESSFSNELASGVEAGLGRWLALGCRINGEQIEVIKYLDSPNPEVFAVRANRDCDQKYVKSLIMQELQLTEKDIEWQRS